MPPEPFDPATVHVAPKIDIPLDEEDSRYVKSFTVDQPDEFLPVGAGSDVCQLTDRATQFCLCISVTEHKYKYIGMTLEDDCRCIISLHSLWCSYFEVRHIHW